LSISGGIHYITEKSADPSILETIGKGIAWIFAPLGFGNWQSAVATILGLVAKEQVVSTFEVLSQNAGQSLSAFLTTPLAGFSFMSFNLLCAPCFAAMGAIRREMNNGKWTLFAISYMCVFAYAVSLMIFQFGSLFQGNGSVIGSISAVAVLGIMIYLLIRKNKNI
jgi:ferrous iron transport protein B